MSMTVGELVAYLKLDDKEYNSGLDKAEKRGSGFGESAKKAAIVGSAAAGAAIAGMVSKGVKDFVGFEGQMNEVFTLLPGITDEAMGKMTTQVKDLSREMGVLPDEAVPALYQAISASVPADNVFDFLETAQKAAVGGVSDLETAVDGISSVVNAYGADMLSAADASDLMFTAVKLGKTDLSQLSSSLFNVTPTAAALGVEFGDVTAALAAMTAQGVPTSVATTQLRQLFVELSKAGGDADLMFREIAGQSFKEFIASGGNMQDALLLMEGAAKDSGLGINDLFGSVEAGAAALSLTGKNTDSFGKALTEMGTSAGATDKAFATMENGAGRSLDKLKANFSTLSISIGTLVLPIFSQVVEKVSKVVAWFDNLSDGTKEALLIFGGIVAAVGPLLIILPKLVSGVQLVNTAFRAIGASNPYVLALMAIVTAVTLVIKYHDEIWAALKQAWDWIKDKIVGAATAVWDFLKEWGPLILTAVAPVIGLPLLVIQHWDEIVAWFRELGGKIAEFLSSLWEIISRPFSDAWDAVSGFFTDTLGPGIKTFFTETLPEKIKEGLDKLYEWIVQPFVDLWTQHLGPWFTETWDKIKTFFVTTLPEKIKAGLDQLYQWIVQPFVNLWTKHLGPWFTGTWEKIKTFFTETLPNHMKQGLDNLYKWIVQPFVNIWTEHLGPWFTETWDKIKAFFTDTLPAKIKAGYEYVKNAIVAPFKAAWEWIDEHVIGPLTSFWNRITGWMNNDAEKALAKAREVNAAIAGATSPREGGTYLSAPGGDVGYKHALGGVFSAPHFGLVAESGPEAIVPLTNPSRAAQVMAQAGLGGNTININATVNLSANSYAGGQAAASGFLDGLRDRCAIAGVRVG